jgi:hypothetical protein
MTVIARVIILRRVQLKYTGGNTINLFKSPIHILDWGTAIFSTFLRNKLVM